MNVRPTGLTLAWPCPATSVTPANDSPEQVARDILESGAQLKIKRRWWFGYATLDAEKAAAKLREGNRPVQVVRNGLMLPVHNLEDLTEVAVFSHLRPVQLLKSPEVGEQLLALEKLGPRLLDRQGREVGGYGAYNALTDSNHQSLGAQLQVNDLKLALELTNLPGLAAFYQNDKLGRLELEGYQFFDRGNQRQLAYGSTPEQVGKDHRPWLPVNDPDLETSVARFQQLMAECSYVEAARRLFALKPAKAEIESLCQSYGESRVIPGVMRAVDQLPTAEVLKLAGELPGLGIEGQRRFLDLLAGRPETAAAASLARRLHEGIQTTDYGILVFRAALENPPVGDGLEVSQFLGKLTEQFAATRNYYDAADRKVFGQHALEELAKHPETRPGAERILSWQPDLPFGLARRLLANPTVSQPDELRALAAGFETGDQKLRARLLEELKADPAGRQAATLYEMGQAHCQYDESKAMLLRAAVRHPHIATGREAAALYLDALGQVSNDPQDYYRTHHRNHLAAAALEGLKQFPDTQAGAERVRAWGSTSPYGPTKALLANPGARTPQELRRIAQAVEGGDQAAQKKVLDELAADPATSTGAAVARVVWDRCPSDLGKVPAYQAALSTPVVSDGKAAAAMLEKVAQELDKPTQDYYKSSNQAGLGQAVIEVLQKFPDTKVAAEKVASWQPAHPHGIARKLLENPTASTPDELWGIALGTDNADTELQNRVLAEVRLDPARQRSAEIGQTALARMYSADGKAAAFRAALRHPSVTSGVEAAAMLSEVAAAIDGAPQEDYYKPNNQRGLGQAVLEILQQFPDSQEGARKVAAWNPQQPYGVARGLLANPGAWSQKDLREIALGATPGDGAMETALMAELKASPDTEKAVTLLESAYSATYSPQGKTQLFRTALRSGKIENGSQAAELYRSAYKALKASADNYLDHSEQALGVATLAGLESFPETQAGAARLKALSPARPAGVAQALLKNPTRPDETAVFLACDPNDEQFMRNVMAEQPHGELKTALFGEVYYGKKCVFEASLTHPNIATGVEHAAFLADVAGRLQASKIENKAYSLQRVTANALLSLQSYPDTERAAKILAGWNLGQPQGPVSEWLKTPAACDPADLRRYARAAGPGESNSKALGDLGETSGQTMVESLHSAPAKHLAYRMALDGASIGTGAQARDWLKALDEKLLELPQDWSRSYDQAGFAKGVAEVLSRYPDTGAEAGKVAGWKTAPTYQVARILLESPQNLSLKAFDTGFLVEGDRQREEAVLAELLADPKSEMAARIARVCCEEVKHSNTRFALVLGALTTPQIRTSEDVDVFFSLVARLSAGHESEQLKSLAQVYRTGFGLGRAAGVGLAEEEQRILVGGVVVKKR